MAKIVEKVPGWVGRFLLPEIERVVDHRINTLKEIMATRFQGLETKIDEVDKRLSAKIDEVEKRLTIRMDEMEKRMDALQRLAVLEAQVKELREKR